MEAYRDWLCRRLTNRESRRALLLQLPRATLRELAAANPGETFTLDIVKNVRKEIFGVLRPCRSVTNDQVADMKAAMNALEAAHDSLLATVTQLAGEVRALQDLAEELSARIRTIEHRLGLSS